MDQFHQLELTYFTLILMLPFDYISGNGCSRSYQTIYVRSEGYRSSGADGAIIQRLTLSECADQCTSKAQGINCSSFEYDATILRCVLKEGSVRVTDNTTLVRGTDNIAFFQQLCILETNGCPSPYAFEKLPGHILIGIAREVVEVGTLEECLSMCLNAREKMKIDCRSVMYYYDTGECILNAENRVTSKVLITNETFSMRVDYFENNCLDVDCPSDSAVHWIKVEQFTISDQHDIFMEQVTKEQCVSSCTENKIDNQPFPCKLYAYSESRMECHLTSESGLVRHSTASGIFASRAADDRETFEFYEKICLKGPVLCQDSSFEHVSDHAIMSIENKIVPTSSMASCLEHCFNVGKECNAVMFFREKDECVMSEKTQYSTPKQFQKLPEVDYFDNVCDYVVSSDMFMRKKLANVLLANNQPEGSVVHSQITQRLITNEVTSGVVVEHDTLSMDNVELEPVYGKLETECGADGIVVIVRFEKPTAGAIFVKDHFATCRSEFTNTLNVTLKIALPNLQHDNPPCPGFEISPSTWSFVVVVQKNGLGIPALMTDADRVFNISCDYSNADIENIPKQKTIYSQAASSYPMNTSAAPVISGFVRLTILRDGLPVSSVAVGEELEMRWTLAENKIGDVGLFLNRCIAERLDGLAPQPPPLTLIADGCISNKVKSLLMRHPIVSFDDGLSTKIKIFRFDGSHRVRILCSVDICVESCTAVICEKNGYINSTNRIKRKRQTLDYSAKEDSKGQVKRQFITGTLTIVEKTEELISAESNVDITELSEQSLNQMWKKPTYTTPIRLSQDNQRIGFIVLITVTITLSITHIYILYKYIHVRSQQFVFDDSVGSCSTAAAPPTRLLWSRRVLSLSRSTNDITQDFQF